MFDALLGRKFYTKCKANLKLIKIRMVKITKRRNSVQKFFRADIADLLKNNLDINAYGRAEGLLVEISMSSCYEMIDKFCGCIAGNLSTMDKQMECPDECREAVPSLMYAAARFADLPELRDLRNLFSTKYGNSLDVYVSKEFVESLKLRPPTNNVKLQLLQEVAHEASIDWDSKALEQKLCTPTPDQNRPMCGSFGKEDDNSGVHKQEQSKNDRLTSGRGDNQSDNKKPHHHGLVPPPPYYSKIKEASPASSSDSETFKDNESHLHKTSDAGTEKPKPRSVRRNRLNHTSSQDNEDSLKALNKSDPVIPSNVRDQEESHKYAGIVPDEANSNLQPPPYLRTYGGSSDNRRSNLAWEGKHSRGQSLPQEPSLSPRSMQGPTRAALFEPDGMKGHIHPNLPNYEDLASRIASLTGR